jgi:hypothetical protein
MIGQFQDLVIASRSEAEAKQSPPLTKVEIASPPKGGAARNDRLLDSSLEAAQ